MSDYKIIRNFRGSWPNWIADLDDGRVVFIYIRWGEIRIGVGCDAEDASHEAEEVMNDRDLAGVSSALDALIELEKKGYHYCCPN